MCSLAMAMFREIKVEGSNRIKNFESGEVLAVELSLKMKVYDRSLLRE